MLEQLIEAKVKLIAFMTALTWGTITVDQKARIDAAEYIVFSIGLVDFRITTVVSILAGVGTLVTIIWTVIQIRGYKRDEYRGKERRKHKDLSGP